MGLLTMSMGPKKADEGATSNPFGMPLSYVKNIMARMRATKKEIRTTIECCKGTLEETSSMLMDHFKRIPASQLSSYIKSRFNNWDANGDGVLQRDELGEAMASMGRRCTEDELDELVKEMDKDGDGVLTLQEFESLIKFKLGLQDRSSLRTLSVDDTAVSDGTASTIDQKDMENVLLDASDEESPMNRGRSAESIRPIKGGKKQLPPTLPRRGSTSSNAPPPLVRQDRAGDFGRVKSTNVVTNKTAGAKPKGFSRPPSCESALPSRRASVAGDGKGLAKDALQQQLVNSSVRSSKRLLPPASSGAKPVGSVSRFFTSAH